MGILVWCDENKVTSLLPKHFIHFCTSYILTPKTVNKSIDMEIKIQDEIQPYEKLCIFGY